jgi:16S rRNA processing protein RimM
VADPTYLAVGRILRAHGLQGEVQVEVLTDHPGARFAPGSVLLVGSDPGRGREPEPREVIAMRPHGARLILRLAEVNDRADAERVRGLGLWIPVTEAAELDEGSYYVHQLEDLNVRTVAGRELGRVRRIMETGATDVLVVRDDQGGKDVLLPMRAEILVEIDLAAGHILVDPLPGLLEEPEDAASA